MLRFWKSSKPGRRGTGGVRSSSNSTPITDAAVSVEGAFGHAREAVARQRTTTAEVTAAPRPSSLRGSRKTSVHRSPTIDEVLPAKEETRSPAAAEAGGAPCMDRSVQTSDELLQPLFGEGLRQRRRAAAAAEDDVSSPVRDGLDELASRPWRRHSLSSLSPLSPRLASPVDDPYRTSRPLPAAVPTGDLNLDDVLGNESVRSLSPLSIAEMTSPPRRWRRLEPRASGDEAFPLRCYDVDDRRRWDRHAPRHYRPNYVFGLPPPSPQPLRLAASPPQRAPLKRQKPCLGAVRAHAAGSGRPRGIVAAGVETSPVSSGSSGAGAAGRDDGGDSSEGAGNKSLSTVSLEDAISRSMSRLSDDDDVTRRLRRVAAVPPPDVTRRAVTRNDVTRNDVTGTGRPPVMTSRRPVRPVVLSSDV